MRLSLTVPVDWSNFEIADMDWFRGEAYQKYFDFLEKKGGFYYEVCFLTLGNIVPSVLTFFSALLFSTLSLRRLCGRTEMG
jgi:hypothetical protein